MHLLQPSYGKQALVFIADDLPSQATQGLVRRMGADMVLHVCIGCGRARQTQGRGAHRGEHPRQMMEEGDVSVGNQIC